MLVYKPSYLKLFLFVLFSFLFQGPIISADIKQGGFDSHALVVKLKQENPKVIHKLIPDKLPTPYFYDTLHVTDENDALVNYSGKESCGTVGLIFCIALLVPSKKSVCHLNEYCHKDASSPLDRKLDLFFSTVDGFSPQERIHVVTRQISERLLQVLTYLREKEYANVTLHTFKGILEEPKEKRSFYDPKITMYLDFESWNEYQIKSWTTTNSLEYFHPWLNVFIKPRGEVVLLPGRLASKASEELRRQRQAHRPHMASSGIITYLSTEIVSSPELRFKDGELVIK